MPGSLEDITRGKATPKTSPGTDDGQTDVERVHKLLKGIGKSMR